MMPHGTFRRQLDVQDADIRSEYAARVNIAAAQHRAHMLSHAQFIAEVDAAEIDRMNKTGDMIRLLLKS
jgi:hypothetical protein